MGNSKSSKVDLQKEAQDSKNSNEIVPKSSSNENKTFKIEDKQNETTNHEVPVIPKLKLTSSDSIKRKQFSSLNTRVANSDKLTFSNDSPTKAKLKTSYFPVKKGGILDKFKHNLIWLL